MPYSVAVYTLGCKVNQYESTAIEEAFESRGFILRSPEQICDAYVINTCTVTAESDRKGRQIIRRLIGKNKDAVIAVCGCFAQMQPDRIAQIKGVDYICGNAQKLSVVERVAFYLENGKPEKAEINRDAPHAHGFESMHIKHFDRTRAYVKIEDGCENKCTYCIISTARGQIRSKPLDEIQCETTYLVENGCKDVVLTGIETSAYGRDIKGVGLIDVLEKVDAIPGIDRVRLGSLDPTTLTQDFVDRLAKLKHIAPHFHISLQSGSNRILARMKRPYNREMVLKGIERVKAILPDVMFTTDVITGFPGETDEDFEETYNLCRQIGFIHVHAFPYSRRKGTEADLFPDQVDEDIKKERVARLGKLEKEIRRSVFPTVVGKTVEVLFETYGEGQMTGHTPNFMEVKVNTDVNMHGEIRKVLILNYDDDYLYGEVTQ